MFFAIRGYLNAHSLLPRRSLSIFFVSRALRIYPALAALGAVVTDMLLSDYFCGCDVPPRQKFSER